MKLYYTPGTCSLCPHIVLKEIGAEFELEKVDLQGKKIAANGDDYYPVNGKGQVPALELDSGETLTECSAIIQYLADHNPDKGLAPANGTMERYRLVEWISFIGSELHKGIPPLFLPNIPEDYLPIALAKLSTKLKALDAHLADNEYLMGESYSVADSYCFAIMNWHKRADLDLSPWPHLKAYQARIEQRPAVQAALNA
jgi:glutathione S-transferase